MLDNITISKKEYFELKSDSLRAEALDIGGDTWRDARIFYRNGCYMNYDEAVEELEEEIFGENK